MIRTLAALSVFTASLFAQQSVAPQYMYHRVYAVVPLIGSGTAGDPKRPMLVPAPSAAPSDRTGIIGYQMQLSDDRKFALVEFVFETPSAFQNVLATAAAAQNITVSAPVEQGSATTTPGGGSAAIPTTAALQSALQSAIPGLKLFERGVASKDDVLAEFQKYKQGFSFNAFTSVRP